MESQGWLDLMTRSWVQFPPGQSCITTFSKLFTPLWEYYQNCSGLDCVTQCSQSAAHLYEQFLQVQQIGFVTVGPLRHAWRQLTRAVTWWSGSCGIQV